MFSLKSDNYLYRWQVGCYMATEFCYHVYWFCYQLLHWVASTCFQLKRLISNTGIHCNFRYGFHKTRCIEALQVCDGDIGLALEYLLSECFHLTTKFGENTDTDNGEYSDILEQRKDEMTALEAIYEDRFIERVANKVWILKFSLPVLDKIIRPVRENVEDRSQGGKDVCKFYSRGFCKFGRRCRQSHSLPKSDILEDKTVGDSGSELNYEVEIRFPAGNMYPKEPPYIAFSSTSTFLPHHVCLNITKQMVSEAKTLAESCEPSVFTVVSCLDDETFLNKVVKEPLHEFSMCPHSKPWLRKAGNKQNGDKYVFQKASDMDNSGDLAEQTEAMLRMTENENVIKVDSQEDEKRVPVKRTISRDMELTKANPAELLKQNRKLIEEFKQKKVIIRFTVG